jgi:lipopolysaccharide export system protein LptA
VRLTIERMRTLVLAAGALLLVALLVFLAIGKWKNPFSRRDLPQRLGLNIVQEADGYTYAHALGAHSQYKIHAAKLVQLKDNRAVLHDVKIELFDNDGGRVDRIQGGEFEYDQQAGTIRAEGPVEITLIRPGVAPAIAPKAKTVPASSGKSAAKPLIAAAQTAAAGEIQVKTSGLSFDRASGKASTDRHVDFSLAQGAGSSMGATYDSQKGVLVLQQAVVLHTRRGKEPVDLDAQHAEFDRDTRICRLHAATLHSQGDDAAAGDATVLFREDGSAVRLDAVHGFTLTTASGGHLAAPTGQLDFDEHNQPHHGHMEGGVLLDSASRSERLARKMHGSAPTAELQFDAKGNLRQAHLERGVELQSEELSEDPKAGPLRVSRNWKSPLADLRFRIAAAGQIEPESMHGGGGVVVTGESQRGKAAVIPSRIAADDLTGQFAPGATLSSMLGVGRASFEQTSATGTRQTTRGDRLEAHFPPPSAAHGSASANAAKTGGDAAQIQSASVDGHVVLTQEPAAKPGAQPQPPLRATAGRAVYEGAGELLHLTLSPRVEDGAMQLTADKIDVAQASGEAFAHGNVKASWLDTRSSGQTSGPDSNPAALGGQGPSHAIAAEAQFQQATGEATFRGDARLWQQANSVAAPVIVLDRTRQTLTAHTTSAAEPVKVVLLSATGLGQGKDAGKPAMPAVIRLRGGDLRYSDAERKALMRGGVLNRVTAETGTATSVSNEVELILLPAGNHAAKDGAAAQVDRMIARHHVVLTSEGRRGAGEQLVYSGQSGEYVLTGSAAVPPRITDSTRGTVTGEALIFQGRDDSVTVEGGSGKTTTETRTPK